MKEKLLIALAAVVLTGNAYAQQKVALDPEQGEALVKIIISVVTFLLGLFINPKRQQK